MSFDDPRTVGIAKQHYLLELEAAQRSLTGRLCLTRAADSVRYEGWKRILDMLIGAGDRGVSIPRGREAEGSREEVRGILYTAR